MRRAARALLVILVPALPGWAADLAPLNLDELSGRRVLKTSHAIDVAISEPDQNRVEAWIGRHTNSRTSVLTGPTWAKAFRGDPQSAALFTITRATVKEEASGSGWTSRTVYVVDGRLSVAGREYPIHAHGSESTGRDAIHALPCAAETCVIDAAR